MNSRVVNFFYKAEKENNISARQVFVINRNSDYIQGFDYGN